MLNLLDTLALRYIAWRQDRAAANDPAVQELVQEFGLKKFEVGPDGTYTGTFVTPAAAIIAEGMAQMLTAANAEHYVQFDMLPRLDRRLRPVRVTVQWATGMSPAQRASLLAARLETLRAHCTALLTHFDERWPTNGALAAIAALKAELAQNEE